MKRGPHSVPAGGLTSLDRQLPLLIFVLLVPIVAIFAIWTHTGVRRELLAAAGERMKVCARQIESLLAPAMHGRARAMAVAASQPDLVAYAREPGGEEAERAALAALRVALRASGTTRSPSVAELWSRDGRLLLQATFPEVRPGEPLPELLVFEGKPPRQAGSQPLQVSGDSAITEVVAEVRPADDVPASSPARGTPLVAVGSGNTLGVPLGSSSPRDDVESGPSGSRLEGGQLGYLVVRRILPATQGADLLSSMIGVNASLKLGNTHGGLWTDSQGHVVAAPPGDEDADHCEFESASGVARVGARVAVRDSPWSLWVESDLGTALAPADSLLRQMIVLSFALLALGAMGASWISRRVTKPLRAMSDVAAEIASGRYDRRLPPQGPDEVVRLTHSFNSMAEQVEQDRRELEDRVAQRTVDLQEALRQLRDAQDERVRHEKLVLLGQLAGSVGHELRNPLGVMTNAVYYLEMILDVTVPEVREYLGILRRQISLSEKITNDLLDFTRNRPPQAEAVSLASLADEQIARLGQVRTSIEIDVPQDLEPAWADRVQVGQVVFNLLTNAIQALGEEASGRIVVRGSRERGGRVRLEVSDNGSGVPVDLREKIFEPLFTTRARGIGLGLAVSRRLSEINGGELRLEATPGERGATFVLVLPIAEASRT